VTAMPAARALVISVQLVPLLLSPMRAALGQLGERDFASVPCHVAFAYPSTWEVVRDTVDPQSACNFLIRPTDWQQQLVAHDSVDLYTISLRGVPGDPATAAPENGFERRGTRWVILGETNQRADTVSGSGWRGWHGLASARCYRVDGPLRGAMRYADGDRREREWERRPHSGTAGRGGLRSDAAHIAASIACEQFVRRAGGRRP